MGELKFFKLNDVSSIYAELREKDSGVTFTTFSSARQVSSLVFSINENAETPTSKEGDEDEQGKPEEIEDENDYRYEDMSFVDCLCCCFIKLFE